MRRVPLALVALSLVWMTGCTARPPHATDPASAEIGYWLDRPGEVAVEAEDYKTLWNAADRARERFLFDAARQDYRFGTLTTEPLVGAQPFEPWRQELRTPSAITESALSTTRRSVTFRFAETEEGRYVVVPKVVVEKLSNEGRRVTTSTYFGRLLSGRQRWYAVGRDSALERAIAGYIADRVDAEVQPAPPL